MLKMSHDVECYHCEGLTATEKGQEASCQVYRDLAACAPAQPQSAVSVTQDACAYYVMPGS